MRFTIPRNENQSFPYYTLKVQGGTDVNIAFDLLQNEYGNGVRRYCNKLLVHECVPTPVGDPLALIKAEFMATPDPCYKVFNIFKTSEDSGESGDPEPSIVLEPTEDDTDDDALIGSVVVQFSGTETCCKDLRQSYRLYGYFEDGTRMLLSHGNLYITPCSTGATVDPVIPGDCGEDCWTDLNW